MRTAGGMDERRVAGAVGGLHLHVGLDHLARGLGRAAGGHREAGGNRHRDEVAPRELARRLKGLVLIVCLVSHRFSPRYSVLGRRESYRATGDDTENVARARIPASFLRFLV